MRFSRSFKSSLHSLPSPNGEFIATLFPSQLNIRTTRSLETVRVISLPPEFAALVNWFLWSESSDRILAASANEIRICSTVNTQLSATITNPTSGTTKVSCVAFGATNNEVCVFSDFGLKLSIFNLATSKSVDIGSPKFYSPGVATKGTSYRRGTHNLAVLTRSGGKDIISIHSPNTLEVMRSWYPDTVDAQGLNWGPDGRWIAIWDSASQGHRILMYTADGHLYKIWKGPIAVPGENTDPALRVGVKSLCWNPAGSHLAVGDYSRRVTLLETPSFAEFMSLFHATTIKPADTVQIWQEQAIPSQAGYTREFVLVTQVICPPTFDSISSSDSSPKTGTNIFSFDISGTLLATRTENMPTTLWIWDVGTKILRTVLIFHAPVAKATWHPTTDELLLIRCGGEESRGLVHIWDPSWESPRIIDFTSHMPGRNIVGKTVGRWLSTECTAPAIFFSDSQNCTLASISEQDEGDLPWQSAGARAFDIYGQQEESPLNLVPADEKIFNGRTTFGSVMEDGVTRVSGGSDEVDDTFRFRKFVEPIQNSWDT